MSKTVPWFMEFDCSLCTEVQKIKYRKCFKCTHNPFATAKYKKDQYVKVNPELERQILEQQKKDAEEMKKLRKMKQK